ncbi:hypothetical protein QQ045_007188 [Rhodiola kirilowii]
MLWCTFEIETVHCNNQSGKGMIGDNVPVVQLVKGFSAPEFIGYRLVAVGVETSTNYKILMRRIMASCLFVSRLDANGMDLKHDTAEYLDASEVVFGCWLLSNDVQQHTGHTVSQPHIQNQMHDARAHNLSSGPFFRITGRVLTVKLGCLQPEECY